MKRFLFLILISLPIFGCCDTVDSKQPFQIYVEGIVEKVEYTQTGNSFLNPGHQNNHIYFEDGRSISLPGRLPKGKAIIIGKFNRIWFDNNNASWIRDIEILSTEEE